MANWEILSEKATVNKQVYSVGEGAHSGNNFQTVGAHFILSVMDDSRMPLVIQCGFFEAFRLAGSCLEFSIFTRFRHIDIGNMTKMALMRTGVSSCTCVGL
jgi:hypothetical protein